MSGGKEQLQTQTTKNETINKGPTAEQAPIWSNLYGAAQGAFNKTNNNPFAGDFVAAPAPQSQQAVDMLTGAVTSGQIGQGSQDFSNMAQATAQGKFLDPATNPFLAATAAAALKPVTNALTNQVLPNIKDAAIAGGAYGGARQDLQENSAVQDWGRTAGDLTGNMYFNNYNAERARQMQSGDMLSQAFGLATAPAEAMSRAGAASTKLNQSVIDNLLAKYQNQQTAPWYGTGELAQILTAGGFGTTNASGTATETKDNPNYQDPFMQILKSAIGIGSAVATGGGSGGFGLWGPK